MLTCKFITNGLSIQQDSVLRPCCTWKFDSKWAAENLADIADIANWHQSAQVIDKKIMLDADQWPDNCKSCSRRELNGDYNNMRSNGNSAYSHYGDEDITLEIRPGNVCNFACQTCWPEASSRVANYEYRAGLIAQRPDNAGIKDFAFLEPIAHRIKDVVLLGGEPFYDQNCQAFLQWSRTYLSANQLIFTNGLYVDYEFLKNYSGKITLIFSLDAVGRPAEYIRFGTHWDTVWKNYLQCKELHNVEVRVNVTTSVYNYVYIKPLLSQLCDNWPDLITFGTVNEEYLRPQSIPLSTRGTVIDALEGIDKLITNLPVIEHQQQHVIDTIATIRHELTNTEFEQESYNHLITRIQNLDRVKNIKIADYCPEIVNFLNYSS